MKPAGFENGQGIITAAYLKDPTDKQWDDNAEMKTWRAWMDKYMPGANQGDANYVYAYSVSFLMQQTLKKCGDNLTRENVMKQAANFQKLSVPMLLPGITVSTSPTDFYPIQAVQLAALQGRDLGAVRRHHVGRERARRNAATSWWGRSPKGGLLCRLWAAPAHFDQGGNQCDSRRGFVGGASAWPGFGSTSAVRAEEIRRRCERHRDQDRQHQPLQRPGLGLCRDRQDDRRLLQERQRCRRHQRPQDQVHLARRRLQPAQDGRGRPPARRAGQDLRAVPAARHAVQHGDPQIHEPEEGAAALRRHRRVEVGRSQELPVDHGLPARLPHRRRDLRQAHPGQRQGCQDRRAAPERRLRPRLSRRLQGRAGQGGGPHRQGS